MINIAPFIQNLIKTQHIHTFIVSFSGGVDSCVLLDCMHQLRQEHHFTLKAIYIDHQLQAASKHWGAQTKKICERYKIPQEIITLNCNKGQLGIEGNARTARYQALATRTEANTCLLTAQHQDDQAETVLLALTRGSGVKGLAAMPEIKPFGQGLMARPLLYTRKQQILHYATQHHLEWVEDPSNQSDVHSRNYLRHHIIPALTNRWPKITEQLSKTAQHLSDANFILDERAALDADQHINNHQLCLKTFDQLSPKRQDNLLRYWCQCHEVLPDLQHLKNIKKLCHATTDHGETKFKNLCFKRWQQTLYLEKETHITLPDHFEAKWVPQTPFTLPANLGHITTANQSPGLHHQLLKQTLTIRFRQGGESMRPAGDRHHRTLQYLFHQWHIPPWKRQHIPLIFFENELIAIVPFTISQHALHEHGFGFILNEHRH